MILVGVWSALPPPIWNSENEHGWQVVHCASEAAIFIGWYVASVTPNSLPTSMASTMARRQNDERQPGRRAEDVGVHCRDAAATPTPRA